jgi:hypothetical protein
MVGQGPRKEGWDEAVTVMKPGRAIRSPMTLGGAQYVVLASSLLAGFALALALAGTSPSARGWLEPGIASYTLESAAGRRILPGGKSVMILAVAKTVTESGSGLHIEYESVAWDGSYADLVPEVDEVWAAFRDLAEAEEVDFATLNPRVPGDMDARLFFPVTRGDRGEWQTPRVLGLPTGGSVVIDGVSTYDGALFVDYVMATPTLDICQVAKEADLVWNAYWELAEGAGLSRVHLSPSSYPPRSVSPFSVASVSVSISLTRDDNGRWLRHGFCSGEDGDVAVLPTQ